MGGRFQAQDVCAADQWSRHRGKALDNFSGHTVVILCKRDVQTSRNALDWKLDDGQLARINNSDRLAKAIEAGRCTVLNLRRSPTQFPGGISVMWRAQPMK